MAEQRAEEETRFLNVDLDVEASYDLEPFVGAMGEKVCDLYTGPCDGGFQTHLELSGGKIQPGDAEAAIRGFVELLSLLPPGARRLWDGARTRDFNIGIQAGVKPHAVEFSLPAPILAAVADLHARVVVTVYAAEAIMPRGQTAG
jgi:hypothetical protein